MKFRLVEDNLIGIEDPEVEEVIDELPPKQEEEMENMIDILEDKINMTPIADNHKLYKALDRLDINYDVTEEELRQYLSKIYGPIKHLTYLTNRETNKFNTIE